MLALGIFGKNIKISPPQPKTKLKILLKSKIPSLGSTSGKTEFLKRTLGKKPSFAIIGILDLKSLPRASKLVLVITALSIAPLGQIETQRPQAMQSMGLKTSSFSSSFFKIATVGQSSTHFEQTSPRL